MEIYSIKDEKFRRYGKVWSGFDCTRLIREMEHTPLPEDVIYVPSMEELEVLPEAGEFARRIYGGLPIQIGYCNGSNHRLNALEYHRTGDQYCGNQYGAAVRMAAGCDRCVYL